MVEKARGVMSAALRWSPWILVASMVLAHVVLSVFWRSHDSWDDTGYMLAIMRGARAGGVLYREVFTQYGPFHTQAWLSLLGVVGWPVDHNHVGIAVCLFWLASVLLMTGWAYGCTQSRYLRLGFPIFGAWALANLTAELGHPLSLAVLLILIVLSAGLAKASMRGLLHLAVSGGALAALTLTKINLGLFAGVAVALSLVIAANGNRRLSHLAAVVSLALPGLLVSDAWPANARWLLGAAVCVPTLMAVRVWGEDRIEFNRWRSELAAWAAGFLVTATMILGVAALQGVGLADLREGVLSRPLKLASISQLPPTVTTLDLIAVASSLCLAVLWHLPSMRRRRCFWASVAGVCALLVLWRDAWNGRVWFIGANSLLWLGLVTFEPGRNAHRRALLLGILLTTWEALGIFPVFGSQSTLPRLLAMGVWSVILVNSVRQAAALADSRWSRSIRQAGALGFAFGLLIIGHTAFDRHQRALTKHAPCDLTGGDWFSFPSSQSANFRSITENLSQTQGPLFTLHGQCSFPIWTNKQPVNSFNCTHLSALLSPAELADTLGRFRAQPEWCALVFRGGSVFGKGPNFELLSSFVTNETKPWLMIDDYELRRSNGAPLTSPRHAFWQEGGRWHLSAPDAVVRSAKNWRLMLEGRIRAGGKWSAQDLGQDSDSSGYSRPDVPPSLLSAMEKMPEGSACLLLCSKSWQPLAVLPKARLITASNP